MPLPLNQMDYFQQYLDRLQRFPIKGDIVEFQQPDFNPSGAPGLPDISSGPGENSQISLGDIGEGVDKVKKLFGGPESGLPEQLSGPPDDQAGLEAAAGGQGGTMDIGGQLSKALLAFLGL